MSKQSLKHSEELELVSKPIHLFKGSLKSIKAIIAEHELIRSLVSRELKARYKDSSLGLLWSLMRPLVQLLIYYVAIGQFLGAARSIPDFALFVFSGLTIWGFFSEIVSGGTISIINNAGLVKKIYVPREIFPVSVAGGAVINLGFQLIILIAGCFLLGSPPDPSNLLLAVGSIVLILVFGLAISLMLAALTVYLRDLEHLVEIGLMILFWASPIVYSMSFVHSALGGTVWESIYQSNPITLSIVGMQKAFWSAGSNSPGQYWPPDLGVHITIALAVSAVLLYFAQRLFQKLQGDFAQEL